MIHTGAENQILVLPTLPKSTWLSFGYLLEMKVNSHGVEQRNDSVVGARVATPKCLFGMQII